jgi:hypothetical protein
MLTIVAVVEFIDLGQMRPTAAMVKPVLVVICAPAMFVALVLLEGQREVWKGASRAGFAEHIDDDRQTPQPGCRYP